MEKHSLVTEEIITFFNRCAPNWDRDMIRDDEVIGKILTLGGVRQGVKVLDVACGTGVLIPDYLEREVDSVLGVDISPKMIEIAESKFLDERVKFLCDDIYKMETGEKFDCIVVYNAFPHFDDPEGLVSQLAGMLVPGGALTIAHGMSREMINRHHEGAASHVSKGLMDVESLTAIFSDYLTVKTKISDDRMYQVTGVKERTGKTT